GLVVEQLGAPVEDLPGAFRVALGTAFGREMSYTIADEAFEDFVCGSVPKELPIDDFRKEIVRLKELHEFWNKWHWEDWRIWPPIEDKCKCAPIYEPGWWNVSTRQPYNNCYNYATNYRTDTFAQPGRASGAIYSALNCSEVKAGAIADELIDSPSANNKCPDEGHLVALAIWPGWDYHWYRKGKDGLWSHKPGGTAVTNLDNSGNTIADPRNADRGGYTDFCAFMVVKHGHIKIA
ncbi:MAG: hypothetical protein GY938_10225, partial [Ketobacter sp.]|nr:hypothetical protein [Ketobacter sp.]